MSNELDRRRQRLVIDGLSIDYFEAGDGHPVIVFPAKDADSSNSLLTKACGFSSRHLFKTFQRRFRGRESICAETAACLRRDGHRAV